MKTIYEVQYLFFKVLKISGPVNTSENLRAVSLFPEKCSCPQICAQYFWRFMNPRSPSVS